MPLFKIYTVRIDNTIPTNRNLWYLNKPGEVFTTMLTVIENSEGHNVPVFKLNVPPFFHIYPMHCTVIDEKILDTSKL